MPDSFASLSPSLPPSPVVFLLLGYFGLVMIFWWRTYAQMQNRAYRRYILFNLLACSTGFARSRDPNIPLPVDEVDKPNLVRQASWLLFSSVILVLAFMIGRAIGRS